MTDNCVLEREDVSKWLFCKEGEPNYYFTGLEENTYSDLIESAGFEVAARYVTEITVTIAIVTLNKPPIIKIPAPMPVLYTNSSSHLFPAQSTTGNPITFAIATSRMNSLVSYNITEATVAP